MTSKRSARTATVAGIGAALVAATTLFGYLPQMEAMGEAREQTEATALDNDALERRIAALAEENEGLDGLKSELGVLRGQFPTSLELANFTRYLSERVGSGLVVQSVVIGAAQPVEEAWELPQAPDGTEAPAIPAPPRGLFMYPTTIKVEGTLQAAEEYLDKLQGEDPGTRMFLVDRLTWAEAEGDGQARRAVFTIGGMTFALIPAQDLAPKEGKAAPQGTAEAEAAPITSAARTSPSARGAASPPIAAATPTCPR